MKMNILLNLCNLVDAILANPENRGIRCWQLHSRDTDPF